MMQITRKTAIAIGLTAMSATGLIAQNRDATTVAADLSCGATITKSVTLTKDLLNCAVDGLVVGANGITIDLNGHRITGTFAHLADDDIDPNRCYCGINDTAGYNRITLSGGLIEGFYDGADFYDTHDIVVRDLISRRHRSDGLYLVSVTDVLVADSQFSKAFRGVSAFFGAHYNHRVIVRNSSFADIGHSGVALVGTYDSVVRDTTMTLGGGEMGIEIANSSNNLVTHNQIRGWTADGILLGSCPCFDARPVKGNTIVENDLRNGGTGIELVEVDGGSVRDNLISGNLTIGTSDSGILVGGLTSRTGDATWPCDPVVGGGPSDNRIKDNTSNSNALDGIHLNAPGNVIAGNTANRNREWGIYAAPGNADGGGNQASRNGQAAQCIGVSCS